MDGWMDGGGNSPPYAGIGTGLNKIGYIKTGDTKLRPDTAQRRPWGTEGLWVGRDKH